MKQLETASRRSDVSHASFRPCVQSEVQLNGSARGNKKDISSFIVQVKAEREPSCAFKQVQQISRNLKLSQVITAASTPPEPE